MPEKPQTVSDPQKHFPVRPKVLATDKKPPFEGGHRACLACIATLYRQALTRIVHSLCIAHAGVHY